MRTRESPAPSGVASSIAKSGKGFGSRRRDRVPESFARPRPRPRSLSPFRQNATAAHLGRGRVSYSSCGLARVGDTSTRSASSTPLSAGLLPRSVAWDGQSLDCAGNQRYLRQSYAGSGICARATNTTQLRRSYRTTSQPARRPNRLQTFSPWIGRRHRAPLTTRIGVYPLSEDGYVDLRLSVGDPDSRVDSTRAAMDALWDSACFPCERADL